MIKAEKILFSYNLHGNVDTLLQDYRTSLGAVVCDTNAGNRFKKMVYYYDLISGKVNDVVYQPGNTDQFYHRYLYDAENRITSVKTSKDKIYWEQDATYSYYRHGPLSRSTLGQNQVQGLDYAYTIQGWLKGVNSTSVGTAEFDMGLDGKIGADNNLVARDAFGFSLNYFTGDYKPINTGVTPFITVPMALPSDPVSGISTGHQLFNGNIGAMAVNIAKLSQTLVYGYRYDQLNRIVRMDAFRGFENSDNSFSPIRLDMYHEAVTYDPNGNIRKYLRNGTNASSGPLDMDSLSYKYYSNTNKLRRVTDAVSSGNYADDINNQSDTSNYVYDAIGNLVEDKAEGITSIEWTVYGKIKSITKSGTIINYTYDAAGNRISKAVTVSGVTKTTYYVRDASGNVMSIYQAGDSETYDGDLTQTEIPLYGSNRLGIFNVNTNVQCPAGDTNLVIFTRGNKFFELSNHLGNVLVTISDKKIPVSSNGTTVDYYTADVISAQDYYAFGFGMPGRKYQAPNSSKPRYGFNGKEQDKETSSTTTYDYGFRIYSPALGRFLSVDPLTKKYPMLTPYQFASNTPIQAIDLDGLEAFFIHGTGSDNSRWIISDNNKNTLEGTNQLLRITGNATYNAQFEWGGKFLNWGNGPFNNKTNRHDAAIKLVNYIMPMVDGTQDVTLVGHSHGGNVAIQALPILRAALDAKGFKDVMINLITLSTPVDNSKGSVENPETYGNLINKHIHIFNTSDLIQVAGADAAAAVDGATEKIPLENFKRKYKFSKTQNVELDVEKLYTHKTSTVGRRGEKLTIKSVDGVGAHSVDNEHPEFIKQKIDDGTIPKIK